MRRLKIAEIRKRGCEYCTDSKENPLRCPYEKCPYKVLDKYDSYGKFQKSKDAISPEWGVDYEND